MCRLAPRLLSLSDLIEGAHAGFGAPLPVYTSISSLPSLYSTCPFGSSSIRV